ncbi:hypothetical protein JW826_00775 [Candidatus Woesearchaeota archaeon]|nr:hypothetical protein [Candidatus Woesearchaeota archaeon]
MEKRFFSLLTVVVLALVFSQAAFAAQDLCVGLVSDKLPHAMTSLSKPVLGDTAVDPEFKTIIRRITSVSSTEGANAVIRPVRSSSQAWNADESRLLLWHRNLGFEMYDGSTYLMIRQIPINPVDPEQVMWDPIDPDILYFTSGVANIPDLMRYRVSTNSVQKVKNFEGTPTSCPRDAGQLLKFGDNPLWMSTSSEKVVGLQCGSKKFLYSITNDQIISTKVIASSNAASPAPSGNVFLLDGKVLDRNLAEARTLDLSDPSLKGSLGKTLAGDDVYVAPAYSGSKIGALIRHKLSDGTSATLIGESTGYPSPPTVISVSATAMQNLGWVAVSVVGSTDGSRVLDQEILLSNLNTGRVCRVAHHRSSAAGSWGALSDPGVVISPKGTRLLFASDWGGGNTVDSYVIELAGYPSSSDSTPPSISGGFPSGSLATGINSTSTSVNTSEVASCRYSTSPDVDYDDMQGELFTVGGLYHYANISGLVMGTGYAYYVKCLDAFENSNTGDYVISFSTPFYDMAPPELVQNLAAKLVSSSQININWTAASDNHAVAGYLVFRNSALVANVNASLGNLSFQSAGLSPDTTYSFSVSAYDVAGNVGNNASISATTPSAGTGNGSGSGNPLVSIAAPEKDELISGMFLLRADASDDDGISTVELYLGGELIETIPEEPYEMHVNSSVYADGSYELYAIADDTQGNKTESTHVRVTFENVPDTNVSATPSGSGGGSSGGGGSFPQNEEGDMIQIRIDDIMAETPYDISAGQTIRIDSYSQTHFIKVKNIESDGITVIVGNQEFRILEGDVKELNEEIALKVHETRSGNATILLKSLILPPAQEADEETLPSGQVETEEPSFGGGEVDVTENWEEVSPKSSSGSGGTIIVVAIAVIVLGGSGFLGYRNKDYLMEKLESLKKPKDGTGMNSSAESQQQAQGEAGSQQPQESQDVNAQVDSYIRNMKSQGKSGAEIEQELIKMGWSKAAADEALLRNMR